LVEQKLDDYGMQTSYSLVSSAAAEEINIEQKLDDYGMQT
jgi:hypothetical protein